MQHAPGTAFRVVPDDLAREDSWGDMIAVVLQAGVQVIPAQVVKASMQGLSFGFVTADEARELEDLRNGQLTGRRTVSPGPGKITAGNGDTFEISGGTISISLD